MSSKHAQRHIATQHRAVPGTTVSLDEPRQARQRTPVVAQRHESRDLHVREVVAADQYAAPAGHQRHAVARMPLGRVYLLVADLDLPGHRKGLNRPNDGGADLRHVQPRTS